MSAVAHSGHMDIAGNLAEALEARITPRQLEFLALVASGCTYAEVAQRKFVSLATVQGDLDQARKRTNARTVTQLCVMLREARLIRLLDGGRFEPVAQDLRIA